MIIRALVPQRGGFCGTLRVRHAIEAVERVGPRDRFAVAPVIGSTSGRNERTSEENEKFFHDCSDVFAGGIRAQKTRTKSFIRI